MRGVFFWLTAAGFAGGAAAVPRKQREEAGHAAEVGDAGEDESAADEAGEIEPVAIHEEAEQDAEEGDAAGAEADLAFERPAGAGGRDEGETGLLPRVCTAGEDGDFSGATGKDFAREIGAGADLTDEHSGACGCDVAEAMLDFIHRNDDGGGDVAGGGFAGGADVDEL